MYIHQTRKKGEKRGKQTMVRNNTYSTVCSVVNTVREPLDRLREQFGGSVNKGGQSGRPNCKPTWVWQIQAQQAKTFLEQILPRLQIKGRQAEIGIELQASKRPATKAITVADVAREAGMSKTTCYGCLNPKMDYMYRPETVVLVKQAAERVGYQRDEYYVVPDEVMEYRESLRRELTILNQKGATNPPSSSPH